MANRNRASQSLRRYLLWWIAGGGAALVLCYMVLLEFYLDVGVTMRAGDALERVAEEYAVRRAADPQAPLPAAPDIAAYRLVAEVPEAVRELFPPDDYGHGKVAWAYLGGPLRELPSSALLPACGQVPCDVLVFYSHRLDERNWLYLLQGLYASSAQDAEQDLVENATRALSVFLIATLAVFTMLLVNRIRRPVEQLAHWADSLDPEGLRRPPDFRFRELNTVAARLGDAFERLSERLSEEQRFLRHASHELRAPLAVISGNIEILQKINGPERQGEPQGEALARLRAAMLDMQQLTETLLWLHRPADRPLHPEPVELGELVRNLVEENRYLLHGKAVDVAVTGTASLIVAPATPCRIVIANLVRNAFQYTHAGRIELHIGASQITIHNANETKVDRNPAAGDDYGFGLGLKLVEQICARLDWTLSWTPSATGRSTTVRFCR